MCLGTSHQEEVEIVWVVERDFLTVSFVIGDTIDILWANAQKLHLEGNFVCISNGHYQGHSGWITGIDCYELCCAEEVLQSPEFKTFIVEVCFQQFEGFIYIQAIIASSHFQFVSTAQTLYLFHSSTMLANQAFSMTS